MAVNSPIPKDPPPPRVIEDEDDYQYYWSTGGVDIPVPRWLAEILDVPLMVRIEIFLVGVCVGLILAAIAVIISFYSAV